MLELTNTLSRSLERFTPLHPGEVRLYTCGPTVYNRAHIGNLRTFLWEDLLCRSLRALGYAVTQVMNLTDIDDKTIRGATAEGVTLRDFTQRYIDAFHEDLAALSVVPAQVYPRATEHIPEMLEIVRKLTERGHTYEADGSVWFRIASFPSYGALSRIDLTRVVRGARVAEDEYEKEDVRDFVVWKAAKEGELESAIWDSPLGRGRPGWHLECSAMSMKYLGETFDIHTGGVDNIFPHHENEIAQSEGATGRPFVGTWLHAEHLMVDGEKMSKSKGNFYTLADLRERGLAPRTLRYLLISVPYRMKLNFTFEAARAAESAVQRLESLDTRLAERAAGGDGQPASPGWEARALQAEKSFLAALADDLNAAEALGALFGFVKEANAELEARHLSGGDAAAARRVLRRADQVLAVLPADEVASLSAEVEARIAARQEARSRRDFRAADAIRDELAARGILLEDTPQGVRWKRKS